MQKLLSEQFSNNNSEFARAVGVAVSSLNRWIIGEAEPSRRNLIKIAEATGVSLQWLATGLENATASTVQEPVAQYAARTSQHEEVVVNKEKFQEAIETLEEVLVMTNKDMDAKGRAAMIWSIYELLTQTESEKEKC